MRELYERLVRDHHAAVWNSAWRIVRNAADAHDITQEVFLQVLRRGDDFANHAAPERVLRWLAAKSALAHLRADRNRQRREEHAAMNRPEREAAESPEQRELAAAVRRCVAELPEEMRLATVLRFQEGFTFAQLGECLGLAEPTAFERVKKAVAQLRARLAELGHAAVALELETWLAREESVAVPVGLTASLLALPASGVLAGSAAAGASVLFGKPLAIAAAALIALLGGVTWLVQRARAPAEPSRPHAAAASNEGRAARDASAAEPLAATPRRTALDSTESAVGPRSALSGFTRGDFLRGTFGTPASAGSAELLQPVATGELRGLVVDETGRAVGGAHVIASSSESTHKGEEWSAGADCDERGTFRLRVAVVDPAAGQGYSLTIAHPDVLPHRSEAVRVAADAVTDAGTLTTRRVQSDRAGDYALAVHVLDSDGHPVEGAWIRLYRQLLATGESAPTDDREAAARFELQEAWEGGVQTDATGTARLTGTRIGAKWMVVAARHLGLPSLRRAYEVRFTGFQELDVSLPPALSITGRLRFPSGSDVELEAVGRVVKVNPRDEAVAQFLLDAGGAARTKVGGCTVSAISTTDDEPCFATIEPDGRFTLAGLPAGHYRINYQGRLAPAALFEVAAGSRDVELELKANDDLEAHGHHLAEIHARVVDSQTGLPIACEWDCIAAPTQKLAVLRRDHFAAWLAPMGPVQTMVEVEYTLDEQNGEALATRVDPQQRDDTLGVIHATGLEAGIWIVRVRAGGYATTLSDPLLLAQRTLVRDVLLRMERAASVSGRVVAANGTPRAGAIVVALPPTADLGPTLADLSRQWSSDGRGYLWGVPFARCDLEGRFTLAELSPGFDYVLAILPVGGPAAQRAPLQLAAGEAHELGDWSSDAE